MNLFLKNDLINLIATILLPLRLGPALNVTANYYKIPPDIAGATFMAAGASSPELFSSILALFATHSALGIGTAVGSEIVNQLIMSSSYFSDFCSNTGIIETRSPHALLAPSCIALAPSNTVDLLLVPVLLVVVMQVSADTIRGHFGNHHTY